MHFQIAAHHRRKEKCATLKAKQHAHRRGGDLIAT